jgi:hypothetical protein
MTCIIVHIFNFLSRSILILKNKVSDGDESIHYRKRLNFHGPKTHENKLKLTKIDYFRRHTDEIAAENMLDENKQLFSSAPTKITYFRRFVQGRRKYTGYLHGPLTTGIWLFAECHILCRVFYFGHSAKSSLPSATQKTLGKRKHLAKKLFAECFIFDTRQRVSLPSVFFWYSAKGSLPSVTNTTLDKELFAECFFSNTRQRQFKNHILK